MVRPAEIAGPDLLGQHGVHPARRGVRRIEDGEEVAAWAVQEELELAVLVHRAGASRGVEPRPSLPRDSAQSWRYQSPSG